MTLKSVFQPGFIGILGVIVCSLGIFAPISFSGGCHDLCTDLSHMHRPFRSRGVTFGNLRHHIPF